MSTKMKPRQKSFYNGRTVQAGEAVEVVDRDVASMHTCGWDLAVALPEVTHTKDCASKYCGCGILFDECPHKFGNLECDCKKSPKTSKTIKTSKGKR